MRNRLSKILFLAAQLIFVIMAVTASFPYDAYSKSDLQKTGDVLALGLPLAALGSTFYYDDPEGRAEFLKSLISSTLIVYFSKEAVNKVRPNDVGEEDTGKSYPSGHSQAAFSGASFINTRYGYKLGIPAYALAALTAYSRVDAQAHYFDDVVIGGSIAMLCNWYFTTEHSEDVIISPIVGDDTYGLQFQTSLGENHSKKVSGSSSRPRFSFDLRLGPSWAQEAKASSPSGLGTEIDLTQFDDDPIPNGVVNIEAYFKKRHELRFKLVPIEQRVTGQFSSPVSFSGLSFAANTPTYLRYRLYEYQLRYRYEVIPADPIGLKLGLGLGYYDSKVGLAQAGQEVQADEWQLLPLGHAEVSYKFNPRWSVTVGADASYLSEAWKAEWNALAHYIINPNWDISFGYRGWAGEIDENSLKYNYHYQGVTFGIAYSWY